MFMTITQTWEGSIVQTNYFPTVDHKMLPRKTIKWHKKVFFHLLDIAVMNSYMLFKKLSKQKKLRILKLRDALIEELASVDLGMEQPMKTLASSTTLAEYETVDAFYSLDNFIH